MSIGQFWGVWFSVIIIIITSAVDNFLWMVCSTHHVSEIWCTQKLEGVPV